MVSFWLHVFLEHAKDVCLDLVEEMCQSKDAQSAFVRAGLSLEWHCHNLCEICKEFAREDAAKVAGPVTSLFPGMGSEERLSERL